MVSSNVDQGVMYRATTIDSPQYGSYRVFYVDFGHSEVVPTQNIKPLFPQHAALPAQVGQIIPSFISYECAMF